MDAREANERGRELMESEPGEAELHFRRAMELAPEWGMPWYNLGLLCKRQKRWLDSLRYNQEAHRLDPEDEAARWNLGIAATALGQWEIAAHCWEAVGLPLQEGSGPWDYGLGLVPIRVNAEESPEVVWCQRLDPARAEILNVPTPASGRRCHDVVLHDGEPVGKRMLRGQEVSVFNEIEVLVPSGLATFRLEVQCPEGSEGLLRQLGSLGYEAEDWTGNVRMLCRACSEGRPHDEHDRELPLGPLREIGVAAPPEVRLEAVLAGWSIRSCERVL